MHMEYIWSISEFVVYTQVHLQITPLLELCDQLNFVFSFDFLETGFCYVAQAGLELSIFLLYPPMLWECSTMPSYQAGNFLGRRELGCII
jgi:hypothetical protein